MQISHRVGQQDTNLRLVVEARTAQSAGWRFSLRFTDNRNRIGTRWRVAGAAVRHKGQLHVLGAGERVGYKTIQSP